MDAYKLHSMVSYFNQDNAGSRLDKLLVVEYYLLMQQMNINRWNRVLRDSLKTFYKRYLLINDTIRQYNHQTCQSDRF